MKKRRAKKPPRKIRKKLGRRPTRTAAVELEEFEQEQIELARKEAKRRKKKTGKWWGKLKRRCFQEPIEDASQHKAASFLSRMKDESGQIRFWGCEPEDKRPERRKLSNGDFSPEDWIWNPPNPGPDGWKTSGRKNVVPYVTAIVKRYGHPSYHDYRITVDNHVPDEHALKAEKPCLATIIINNKVKQYRFENKDEAIKELTTNYKGKKNVFIKLVDDSVPDGKVFRWTLEINKNKVTITPVSTNEWWDNLKKLKAV